MSCALKHKAIKISANFFMSEDQSPYAITTTQPQKGKVNTIIVQFVQHSVYRVTNCNKFYCNLTFYKLNTYLILTSAWFGFVEQNVSTDKNFLRNILVTRGDPFVCACPRLRSSRCRQTIVERSSLYFWSPAKQIMRGGRVGLSL